MYSAGRQGTTDDLGLEAAGLAADDRGRIRVDGCYRTSVDHVYAVGDVIGFPALAATSMDQGRLAALHAFGEEAHGLHHIQPIGIYTIPEISFCGRTERELTHDSIPYEVGIARYRELATDLARLRTASGGRVFLLVFQQQRHIAFVRCSVTVILPMLRDRDLVARSASLGAECGSWHEVQLMAPALST